MAEFTPSKPILEIIKEIHNIETLRDKFAIAILPVIISNSQTEYKYDGADNILLADCKLAYKIADAMIKAREK